MNSLFGVLSRAVEGAPLVALSASAVWGVLSILLSPCHLASIPLIVGFISDQEGMTTRRAFWTSLCFASGILLTIALIGIITSALGRIAGDMGGTVNYLVAGIFFVVGLHLLGIVRLPFLGKEQVETNQRGLPAAFLLGLVFGLALGPCTFAFMAPVLAVSFRVAADAPVYSAALLLAYGAGHCAVIVGAGSSAEAVQNYLNWNSRSSAMKVLKVVCGVLVIAGGLYMLYTAH
jgi:cytochrome c-type biogenesis protein